MLHKERALDAASASAELNENQQQTQRPETDLNTYLDDALLQNPKMTMKNIIPTKVGFHPYSGSLSLYFSPYPSISLYISLHLYISMYLLPHCLFARNMHRPPKSNILYLQKWIYSSPPHANTNQHRNHWKRLLRISDRPTSPRASVCPFSSPAALGLPSKPCGLMRED